MYRLRFDDDLLFEFQGQGYMSHGGVWKIASFSNAPTGMGRLLMGFSHGFCAVGCILSPLRGLRFVVVSERLP